jgi:asparagine synthase (glutamine-hydrolysing)
VSGIVGVSFSDGRNIDPGISEKMLSSLVHRGPDSSGIWTIPAVGLGQPSFWTTPESAAELMPWVGVDGSMVVIADIRIDNRDELLAVLEVQGSDSNLASDGELILKAYERWGEDSPKKLKGDFSFVIRDSRRQLLFSARDHIGVKPF